MHTHSPTRTPIAPHAANAKAAAERRGAGGMRAFLIIALAAVFAFTIPMNALASASSSGMAGAWREAAASILAGTAGGAGAAGGATSTAQASDFGANATSAATTALDPADRLDLRERGVVTPVKLQNPWGSCWSFSIIAACETSILSELGTTYEESGLDLSELQLASSVYKIGGVPASVDSSQAGEGYHNTSQNPNAGMDAGGFTVYGSSTFASGTGPVTEDSAPYANKGIEGADGDEPVYFCKAVYKEINPTTGANKVGPVNLSASQLAEVQQQIADGDSACVYKSVEKLYYSGNYQDADGTEVYTDWSVSDDLFTSSVFNLEDGNILPDTRILDANGTCTGTDLAAVKTIQGELQKGRGVSISYCADQSTPDQASGQCVYINENTWAQYTYKTEYSNHVVAIVGYDNGYSKENFGGGDASKQPEGDGAWLVKNSWGAETEDFPNTGNWGILDENGKHTGYFWLSYYDKSVHEFESYDFDVDTDSASDEYYIDQYDYLPEINTISVSSKEHLSSANIFTAADDISLSTVSCATHKPNTKVGYEVYLLDEEASSPTDPDHSTLVCSVEDNYEFAGYHRTKVADDKSGWIAMREGQRYAVVVTEQCLDDGLYYQGVAVNDGMKPTEAQTAEYKATKTKAAEDKYYDLTYPTVLAQVSSEVDPDTGQVYTEEKAKTVADTRTRQAIGQGEIAAKIEKEVAAEVDVYANTWTESVVNAGESWTGALKDGADAAQPASQSMEWADWKTEVKEPVEEAKKGTIVADNAPVKAFAELKSWASVEELDRLAAAIDAADGALAQAKTSVDGTDVDVSETWMTQERRDALAAAVEGGEATLALAGEDYGHTLANTTPDSATVNATTEKLAFETAAGTMQQQAAGDKAVSASDTGDNAAGVLAALAGVMAAAAVAAPVCGCVRRRHSRGK